MLFLEEEFILEFLQRVQFDFKNVHFDLQSVLFKMRMVQMAFACVVLSIVRV